MTARERKATGEPLLSTVARKLGYAAGTLTKATHEITENLAALPETVSTRVREAATSAAPSGRLRTRATRPSRKSRAAVNRNRKSPKRKSTRRRPGA